jgi:hypothetical protein
MEIWKFQEKKYMYFSRNSLDRRKPSKKRLLRAVKEKISESSPTGKVLALA